MAVYTEVDDQELAEFLTRYDIGELIKKTPIAEGVENTNYRLETDAGVFILTLFEKRTRAEDLPFFHGFQGASRQQEPVDAKSGENERRGRHINACRQAGGDHLFS